MKPILVKELREKVSSLIAEIRHLVLTHPQTHEKDQSILSQLEDGEQQITGGHPVTQRTLENLAFILACQRALRESQSEPITQVARCDHCHQMSGYQHRRVLLAQDEAHPDMESRTPRLWLCFHCEWTLIGGHPCMCEACKAKRPAVTLANYWKLTTNQKEEVRIKR